VNRVRAAVVAGALSGIPSTAWSVARRRDPLEATKAAGRLALPSSRRTGPLVLAATAVHSALSLAWATVVVRTLPRDAGRAQAAVHGALMGAAIAALDLGIAHRVDHPRLTAVKELPIAPQIADHVAFGVIAALTATS
jgi:hypothetical protein